MLKYELLQGKRARYVPGWDCHGLPIELKVLQGMTPEQRRDLTTIKLRRKARDFALKAVNQQREGFKRCRLQSFPCTLCAEPDLKQGTHAELGVQLAFPVVHTISVPQVHWGSCLAERHIFSMGT